MWKRRRWRRRVRVRIHAIGVNFIDTYHRSGLYKLPLPTGIGARSGGVVEAIGERRHALRKVGDRVASGTAPFGAYAEAHTLVKTRASGEAAKRFRSTSQRPRCSKA
jgi:NADPH:quinone reductase-like Zn-dependent oxidoreductase